MQKKGNTRRDSLCYARRGSAPSQAEGRGAAEELEHPAIDRIAKTIENKNGDVPPGVSLTAAMNILDRTGHKPIDRHQNVPVESDESKELRKEFTLDELKEILKVVREREEVIH